MYIYYYKENGEITEVSNQAIEGRKYIKHPEMLDVSKWMILDATISLRPTLVEDYHQTLPVNSTFVVNNVPKGTLLGFEDLDSMIEVNDDKIEIELNSVNSWDIVLIPPFPFLSQVIKVNTYET
jgi:hypothetical protein